MSDTPTFGRYAEIPFDKMSPEQQEGYKSMIEARGRLPGPTKIWVPIPSSRKSPARSVRISSRAAIR